MAALATAEAWQLHPDLTVARRGSGGPRYWGVVWCPDRGGVSSSALLISSGTPQSKIEQRPFSLSGVTASQQLSSPGLQYFGLGSRIPGFLVLLRHRSSTCTGSNLGTPPFGPPEPPPDCWPGLLQPLPDHLRVLQVGGGFSPTLP